MLGNPNTADSYCIS